jgi:insulysin
MSIKIEKSENDIRDYKYIKLKNNLEIVIIKDYNETLCGACLNVNIGSANESIPGLAHFLEHMLFMGSKKYPYSNNFMSSINKSGGSTNAYTSNTNTNYYFVCSTDTYLSNLDIFGNFLVNPLLSKKYINKEISNVNSESNKNIVDNDWLQLEIAKTLYYDDHPINHYTAGTIESLSHPNIYDKLKEFKKTFYTAERMSLVLFINDKINNSKLEELFTNTFSLIPSNKKKEVIMFGPPLKANQITEYIPFIDSHRLRLIFQVKTNKNLINSPLPFIYYLLNLKSPGSLFDILTVKKLITNLECGETDELDDYTLFTIDCILTDQGLKIYTKLYNLIKSYVDFLLDSIQKKNEILLKHFLQNLQLNKNNFKFWEKPDINSIMDNISLILKYDIPREFILNSDIKSDSFDAIVETTRLMFDNYSCSMCIGSKSLKLKSYKIFPNYNAKYNTKEIIFQPINVQFELPILNDFIAYNPLIQHISQSDIPEKIDEKEFISFYYGDIKYKVPTVDIKCYIRLPQLLDSINIYTSTLLYYTSAYNSIIKIKDLMENAGYIFYFKLNIDSVYLTISGYSEKILDAIKIIKYFFSGKFSQDNFDQAKYELIQNFKNFSYDTVLSKFATFTQEKIFKTFFMPDKVAKEIEKSNMDDLINIYNRSIVNGRISIFTMGNIEKDMVKQINRKIYKYVKIKHQTSAMTYDNIKEYQENEMFIYKKSDKDINVLVGLLFPLPSFSELKTKNWHEYVLFCRLFEVILGNDFYYELRTEKEIGYVVRIKSAIYENNLEQKIYIKFVVQSSKYKYKYILNEIESFIKKHTNKILNELSNIDYKEYIESEKNKLKREFDTLSDLAGYYMNSIVDEIYQFNSREILLEKIDLFTLDVFRSFVEKFIINNTKLCFVV